MAFSFTDDKTGSTRAIVVRDYRERAEYRKGVLIVEAKLNENGKVYEKKLAELSSENPQCKIEGIGSFEWRE